MANETRDNALATVGSVETALVESAGFATLNGFTLLQRGAQLLATSTLLPDTYHNNLGNCAIVLELAQRLQASPIMVAQNLYVVHGRPSWSSQFLIAGVNQCRRFTALQWEWQGTAADGDAWGCRAWAMELATNQRVQGPLVTIKIAKDEGWYSRNGSKWKTLPELMLMYRAATFFARTHAPELTMGLPTREEVYDTIDTEAVDTETGEIVGRKARVVPMPTAKKEKAKKDPAEPPVTVTAAPVAEAPAAPAAQSVDPAPLPAEPAKGPLTPTYHIAKVEQSKDAQGKAFFLIHTAEGMVAHTLSTEIAGQCGEAKTGGYGVQLEGPTVAFAAAPMRVKKVTKVEEREPGSDDR